MMPPETPLSRRGVEKISQAQPERAQPARRPTAPAGKSFRLTAGLDAALFFLADVRGVLPPFLALHLAARHAAPGLAGLFFALVNGVSALAQVPAGALVDRLPHRRLIFALASLLVAAGLGLLAVLPAHLAPAAGALGLGAAALALGLGLALYHPASAGLTLALSATPGPRLARNEAFNHLGNAMLALFTGLAALDAAGGPSPLLPALAFAALSGAACVIIPPTGALPAAAPPAGAPTGGIARRPLRRAPARTPLRPGRNAAQQRDPQRQSPQRRNPQRRNPQRQNPPRRKRAPGGTEWHRLPGAPGLVPLLAAAALGFLGESGVLALLGAAHHALRPARTGVALGLGEGVMALAAASGAWLIARLGPRRALMVALAALPVRAGLLLVSTAPVALAAAQALDGLGLGLFGVVSAVWAAELACGSGRANLVQGWVALAVSLGAAGSNLLASGIAAHAGTKPALAALMLAGVAALLPLLAAERRLRPTAPPTPRPALLRPSFPVRRASYGSTTTMPERLPLRG